MFKWLVSCWTLLLLRLGWYRFDETPEEGLTLMEIAEKTDPYKIKRLAEHASSPNVRQYTIQQLTDLTSLEYLATFETNDALAVLAVTTLAGLRAHDPDVDHRLLRIYRRRNQKAWTDGIPPILTALLSDALSEAGVISLLEALDVDDDLTTLAMSRVHDQDTLRRFAFDSPFFVYRRAAIGRLTDRSVLAFFARRGIPEAKRRLRDLQRRAKSEIWN